ncbi:lipid-A-disaccharide synthase [Leptospira interrogans]
MVSGSGPLGILAGNGHLPLELADEVKARGRAVHIVGLEGSAGPEIARHPHTWVNIGRVGAMLRAFRAADCRDIVILGGVTRPDLKAVRLDVGFFLNLPAILGLMRGGDDSVLRRVVRFFEGQGFRVIGAQDVAPSLLMGPDVVGPAIPDEQNRRDLETGFALISGLAGADIGQAVVIADGQPVAIEAAEGTDAMLARLAHLRSQGKGGVGGVLVKAPKPGQELRVDLPTIGPRTIEAAAVAGLTGVAVAAGQVLLAERDALRGSLEKTGLFLAGVAPHASHMDRRLQVSDAELVRICGEGSPHDRRDAARALAVITASEPFRAGEAVAVARRHVLAVEAGEGAADTIARAGKVRQWGDRRSRRRRGVVALRQCPANPREIVERAAAAGLAGIVLASTPGDGDQRRALVTAAEQHGLFAVATPRGAGGRTDAVRIFLVSGEHSGDALGGRLMGALRARLGDGVVMAGVGGEQMHEQGLDSLFPLADVAVMGPLSILPRLPRIVRRVHRAVDAAIAFKPDVVVIIDSPEFTHPIAKRIRKRRPDIPIVDYVSPSVWAWRPGRAKKMRAYVDHVLALLPFEPDAHKRLGGPPCTYVGHPLIERWDWLEALDPAPLVERLRLIPGRPVLLVLPGSRASEVGRLMDPFGDAIRNLCERGIIPEVIIPAVPHVRSMIDAGCKLWPVKPHLIEAEDDKFRAFRLADAALVASGTATLELALSGTPMVVGYRVDAVAARLRFLVKVHSFVLANLVLGENAFPEFLQEDCMPDKLAAALAPLLSDTPERQRQRDALARIPERMKLKSGTPSDAAADIIITHTRKAPVQVAAG